MTKDKPAQETQENWRSIVASILFAKAAVATFSIAPFLIGGYIDHLGLSVSQASQALSVEIFALALANASAFFWIDRVVCRVWAKYLLLLLIALNISCIYAPGFEVLVLQRAFVGVVEGMLLALGFGLLGRTQRTSRNFGFYFAISLSVGAINVQILPLFLERFGVTGLFVNLSIYAIIALMGSGWAQRTSIREANAIAVGSFKSSWAAKPNTINFPLMGLLFFLLANYVYFIGQGGVWSFLERLGFQQGLDLISIANALSLSLMAGVAGGFTASWLDLKLGRVVPILTAISFAILAIYILWAVPGIFAFTIAVCLFNYGNNLGHPYILGFAASIDKSARLTVLSGALHTGGQATGPLIAGLLVNSSDFTAALWLGVAAFLATILLLATVGLLARNID